MSPSPKNHHIHPGATNNVIRTEQPTRRGESVKFRVPNIARFPVPIHVLFRVTGCWDEFEFAGGADNGKGRPGSAFRWTARNWCAPPKEGLVKMVLVVLLHFHRQNFSKDWRREFWRLALSGEQKWNRTFSSCRPFPRQQSPRGAQWHRDRLGKSMKGVAGCGTGGGYNLFSLWFIEGQELIFVHNFVCKLLNFTLLFYCFSLTLLLPLNCTFVVNGQLLLFPFINSMTSFDPSE